MGARSHEPSTNDPAVHKAWIRLESALLAGNGHVVVTAVDRDQAVELVDAALERSNALAVLRVRAASADPLEVIDEGTTDAQSASKRREILRELLEKARAVKANVFAVVEDADTASAEQLERVRMAVECVPDAIERLRVVLVGTPQLDLTLQDPAASALASRISAHVRFAPPRKTAKGAALNTLSAVRVAAAGVMTTLFGRNESGPEKEAANTAAHPVAEADAAAPVSPRTPIDAVGAATPTSDDARAQPQSEERAPAPARTASSATSQVAPQVARGARASREGSASVDARGARTASSAAPPKRSSATPAARSNAGTRFKQPVVVEAAAFKEADPAEALRGQLANRFARVLVARVDAARGTFYSVRVMGLESPRDVAHAEREIRSLGHRPVRLGAAAARATS